MTHTCAAKSTSNGTNPDGLNPTSSHTFDHSSHTTVPNGPTHQPFHTFHQTTRVTRINSWTPPLHQSHYLQTAHKTTPPYIDEMSKRTGSADCATDMPQQHTSRVPCTSGDETTSTRQTNSGTFTKTTSSLSLDTPRHHQSRTSHKTTHITPHTIHRHKHTDKQH